MFEGLAEKVRAAPNMGGGSTIVAGSQADAPYAVIETLFCESAFSVCSRAKRKFSFCENLARLPRKAIFSLSCSQAS